MGELLPDSAAAVIPSQNQSLKGRSNGDNSVAANQL